MDNKLYCYDGPVEVFGKCKTNRWTSRTYAPTLRKAISNLKYNYRMYANLKLTTPVVLLENRISVREEKTS